MNINKLTKKIFLVWMILFLLVSTLYPSYTSYASSNSSSTVSTITIPASVAAPIVEASEQLVAEAKTVTEATYDNQQAELDEIAALLDELPSISPAESRSATLRINSTTSEESAVHIQSTGDVHNVDTVTDTDIKNSILTQSELETFIWDGADLLDIYWLAYLVQQTAVKPQTLWDEKESGKDWQTIKQEYMKPVESIPDTVTENVYNNQAQATSASLLTVAIDSNSLTKIMPKAMASSASSNSDDLEDDYTGILNNLIYKNSISQAKQQQFADHDPNSERIDPASGGLAWKSNQMSFPGRDGLDLNIGIMYESNQSSPYTRKGNKKGRGYVLKENNTLSAYDLGLGWSFRFPSITLEQSSMYYNDGEGASYQGVPYTTWREPEATTWLWQYQGKDLRLRIKEGAFSNGQDSSYYYVEHDNLTKEYFAGDGRLLGIVDRYGNTQTFYYQDRQLYNDKIGKVLSRITDSVGRTIEFQYDSNLRAADFGHEDIRVIAKDPAQQLIQQVTYTKGRTELKYNGANDGYAPVLQSVTNINNEATYFNYDVKTSRFTLYNNKYPFATAGAEEPYVLMNGIQYPRMIANYTYEKAEHSLGKKGLSEDYRILSRWDQLYKGNNNEKTDAFNKVDFRYDGDFRHYMGTTIPKTYFYSSTAIQQGSKPTDHLEVTTTFDGENKVVSTEQVGGDGYKKKVTNEAFNGVFTLTPTLQKTVEQDADGTTTSFSETVYNDWGLVASQTDVMPESDFNNASLKQQHTISYSYEDKYRQVISKKWYQNATTALEEKYAYNADGRLQSSTNAAGETVNYSYQPSPADSRQIQKATATQRVRDGVSTQTSTVFGADYQYAYPTEQTQVLTNPGKGAQTVRQTTKYDFGTGRVMEQTDSQGNKTTTSYDALGRPVKVTLPSMTNLDGMVYAIEDQYTYTNRAYSENADSVNQGILTLRVEQQRQYTNTATGAVTLLNRQAAYYDGLGNPRIQETYNENNGWTRTQYHPDAWGRTVYASDVLGNTQTATYDAWNNQTEITDAEGNLYITAAHKTQHKVNQFAIAASNVSAYRDHSDNRSLRLNTIEQTFDNYGNAVKTVAFRDGSVTRNDPIQETYTYDLAGNVLTYTDPNGNKNAKGVTTAYTYDGLNRLTNVQDALDQQSKYAYDGLGNLSSVVISDTTGKSETLYSKNYNELGQLTGKTSTSGKQTNLTYDARGLNNQQTDRKGSVTTYQYDERGQRTSALIQGKDGSTLQTKSIFGSDGNLLSDRHELYLNGTKTATQTSTIDKLDRITKLTSSANGYEASLNVNYDPLDRIQRQSNQLSGSSFITQYGYNKSRLKQIQTDGSNTRTTEATANVQYDYTPLGQVKQITFPTLSDGSVLKETMNYDPLNRLTDLTNTRGGTTLSLYRYTYDANGNILSVQEQQQGSNAKTSSYGYDKLGRLINVKRADGSESTYTYDLRGNRKVLTDTQTLPSTKSGSYVYDLQNTLTSVSNDNGKTILDYLPDGLRFKKTTGDKVTQYSYNGADQVIGDKASNGTVSSYVRGDRVLVKKDLTNQKDYYYLYNGHGDVVQVIGTDGTIVNNYQYDEWGSLTQQKETVVNEFKYAGETYDAETGLYYLKARYYDPSLGRFLNEDSYEGQINSPLSMNGYSYVHNNPLIYVDPTGHWIADDSNLSASSQNKVKQATKEFNNAKKRGDIAGMQAAHNKAVEIRFSSGDYEVVNKMNYTTGKSSPYATGYGGAHPDNSGTGAVFDAVVTGGVGIGSKVVSKGVSSLVASGTRTVGSLIIEEGGNFSVSEIRAARYMYEQGNHVLLRMPQGTRAGGETSDLLVNGINYDVYTPTTTNASRIIGSIASKNSQTVGIVLDLGETTVTADQLGNVLSRVKGVMSAHNKTSNIADIVILPK